MCSNAASPGALQERVLFTEEGKVESLVNHPL